MGERQYSDTMLQSMQSAYGAGFLSPGAAEETRQMLAGLRLKDKRVLDLGCGVGGASVLIAREYDVRHVLGADVEDAQLEQARELATQEKVSNISFERIRPGSLSFPDRSFDLIIAKDVVCHVQDKASLFTDVHRVLDHEGVFVVGDWHPGPQARILESWNEWMAQLSGGGLIFFFEPMSNYRDALIEAGFSQVECIDHSEWSRSSAEQQLLLSTERDRDVLLASLGEVAYARRVAMTRSRYEGLMNASVEHWHLRARKN